MCVIVLEQPPYTAYCIRSSHIEQKFKDFFRGLVYNWTNLAKYTISKESLHGVRIWIIQCELLKELCKDKFI